jgi:hypothetical protein
MVYDYYRPAQPWKINVPSIPYTSPAKDPFKWDAKKLDKLKKLIEAAKEMDAEMGEPDCEDPKKTKWMREIEERLGKLETK